ESWPRSHYAARKKRLNARPHAGREARPMANASHQKLTPPELARRYGIAAEKVIGWIRAGELRALNVAAKLGGRPRYLIDEADIALFEQRRAVIPTTPPARGRSRKQTAEVTPYF